jgi:chorismate dehydratase
MPRSRLNPYNPADMRHDTMPATARSPSITTWRLGVVSFLNALPLRHALQDRADLALSPGVPSALIRQLLNRETDVALLPIVDYWRHRDLLTPVSDACIASDGETLTVRVFSKIPAEQVTHLHVDADSHTSIALARVLWQEMYGCRLELIPWEETGADSDWHDVQSILLIGDKVVRRAPRGIGFGFEVDLGAAWKHLTGLPFVFAAWFGRRDTDLALIEMELEQARNVGMAHARELAIQAAPRHGWPTDTAIEYLTRIMKYRITPEMRAGMERFFQLLDQHGVVP